MLNVSYYMPSSRASREIVAKAIPDWYADEFLDEVIAIYKNGEFSEENPLPLDIVNEYVFTMLRVKIAKGLLDHENIRLVIYHKINHVVVGKFNTYGVPLSPEDRHLFYGAQFPDKSDDALDQLMQVTANRKAMERMKNPTKSKLQIKRKDRNV